MNRKDVKIIQISSEPDIEREVISKESVSKLGYRYIRIINPRYTEYPPTHNVIDGRVDWIKGITKPDHNEFGLTSGHYGAWQGHMSAIMASFVDSDYTLIMECDCLIAVDPEFFRARVDEAINLMENSDYKIVRFEAPNHQVNFTDKLSDNLYSGDIIYLGQCYLISSKHKKWWIENIEKLGWTTPDYYLNELFTRSGERMAIFKDLILTKQASGYSIIDNTFKPVRTF